MTEQDSSEDETVKGLRSKVDYNGNWSKGIGQRAIAEKP